MGGNSNPKKRGMMHYLFEQWKATKTGKEQHQEEMKKAKARPLKPKIVKTSYK